MGKLTAKKVQGKLKAGMHNDGFGLYLRVSSTGGKSWILRCRVHGVKRDIGLGGISWVSLAEARNRAAAKRAVARDGGDPLAERNRAKGIPTFEDAARRVWREQIETTVRNEKHKAQWINTLRNYAFPVIGGKRIDVIRSGDILRVLQLSIPDQKGPMHRRDSGQWSGSGTRLGACACHIADARQGALAEGQSRAAPTVV
ncbi:MAG: Arm DNA-binding domain-containing protein [Kiloniellales bacterium]